MTRFKLIIYIFLVTLGSAYFYLSRPLGLETFSKKLKKKMKKKLKTKAINKAVTKPSAKAIKKSIKKTGKAMKIKQKKAVKKKSNKNNFTNDYRIVIQNKYKPIINKFNTALANNTYDLDNIVDNGILPDDSYLDGNDSRYAKFRMLGNILMDPDNVESITVRDPANPDRYLLKGVSSISKGGLTLTEDYVIGNVTTTN